MAASGDDDSGHIFFAGGTDNPYNYNGIGYNGKPSEPVGSTFAWNVRLGTWESILTVTLTGFSMDHRGLLLRSEPSAPCPGGGAGIAKRRNGFSTTLVSLGGMVRGQEVTAQIGVVERSTESCQQQKGTL